MSYESSFELCRWWVLRCGQFSAVRAVMAFAANGVTCGKRIARERGKKKAQQIRLGDGFT